MLQAEEDANSEHHTAKPACSGKRWTPDEDRRVQKEVARIFVELQHQRHHVDMPVFVEVLEKITSYRRGQPAPHLTQTERRLRDIINTEFQPLAEQLQRSLGSVKGRVLALMKSCGKQTKNHKRQSKADDDNNDDNDDKDDNNDQGKESKRQRKRQKTTGTTVGGELDSTHDAEKAEQEEVHFVPSAEQKRIADWVLKDGINIFYTGAAGTGKSALSRYLIYHFLLEKRNIAVCAPTGSASRLLKGITLHKLLGWTVSDETQKVATLVKRALKNKRVVTCIRNLEVLFIDEISMVSAEMFERMEEFCRLLRKSSSRDNVTTKKRSRVFGGIQLVLCGDFLQLPPVVTKKNTEVRFCFEASCWQKCIKKEVELHTIFRQNDPLFIKMLNEIRIGHCSRETEQIMAATKHNKRLKQSAIRIYPHRKEVDESNQKALAKIDAPLVSFDAFDRGEPEFKTWLEQHCDAKTVVQLKLGCKVILLKNLDTKQGLANGSRGEVIDFVPRGINSSNNTDSTAEFVPLVCFENGIEKRIERQPFRANVGDVEMAVRYQIPLSLAYAVTAHRCQGMTLQSAELSLSDCFEYGQVYVAMSRMSTLAGVIVKDFQSSKIKAHPRVLEYYKTHLVNLTH